MLFYIEFGRKKRQPRQVMVPVSDNLSFTTQPRTRHDRDCTVVDIQSENSFLRNNHRNFHTHSTQLR